MDTMAGKQQISGGHYPRLTSAHRPRKHAASLPLKERSAMAADAPLAFGCDITHWTAAELAAKFRANGPFFRTLWEGWELRYERRG